VRETVAGPHRILLIDDNVAIHGDFRKVLGTEADDARTRPSRCSKRVSSASPSIGIALYSTDGRTIESLTAHADAAMHRAKQRGRGNIQCFARGMNAGLPERVQLESDLHNAIALKEFQLHYQPKVTTATRGIDSDPRATQPNGRARLGW
jgi:predicted signal transduction protein with EAL and GGDEF domain